MVASVFFAMPAVLASSNGFFHERCFSVQDVTDHCTLAGSADSPLFVCRDCSTPLLLGSKHGTGSRGFRWSEADNLGFWLPAHSAPTFISHVSLQVQRKPVLVSTTYPLPAGLQMFSDMKRLPPTRIAETVSRTDGLCAPSHQRPGDVKFVNGQSLLALSSRGALSRSLTSASSSRGRLAWFQEGHGQRCVWNKQHLGRFCVSSAVIGACAGSTSASVRMPRKRASHSRLAKDAASWRRRLVESRNGQASREAPGPSVPSRVRFAPSFRMSIWSVRGQTRMRSRLPNETVARTFPEVSLQLLDPSDWTFVAYGGFFRDEKHHSSGSTFSLFNVVRYAESCHTLGRLLILSSSLALVLALCTGRSTFSHCFHSCVVSLRLVPG